MKKSFLKRVMAAAIAVPVALSQTVMLASFAEDETTTPSANGTKVVNTDTFLKINEQEGYKYRITEGLGNYRAVKELGIDTTYAFVQESTWSQTVAAALNSVSTDENNLITLNPSDYADSIGGNSWYASILKDALKADSASVTAHVNKTSVDITISVNYSYGDSLTQLVEEKVPAEYKEYIKDKEVGCTKPIVGEIVINVNTENLATGKTLDFTVTKDTVFGTVGTSDPVQTAIDFLLSEDEKNLGIFYQAKKDVLAMVDDIKADAEAEIAEANARIKTADAELKDLEEKDVQGSYADEIAAKKAELAGYEADLAAAEKKMQDAIELSTNEIEKIFGNYETKAKNAVEKYNNFDGHREAHYVAGSVDELLKTVHDNAAARNRWGAKLPESLAGIENNKRFGTVSDIFNDVVAQLNNYAAQNGYEYQIDMTLAKVIEAARTEIASLDEAIFVDVEETDVETGSVTVFAYLNDDNADKAFYITEINKELAADNLEVDELFTVKALEANGSGVVASESGTGDLNIYRVVWYTVKEIEETTEPTTEETEPTTDETEPPTDETEPPTDETEPPTDETEPPTDETEPPTDETEPPTDETEPPTDETEPPTDETEPPTDDTEPTTDETEPPTDETEPPTDETEPPTDETEPPTDDTEDTTPTEPGRDDLRLERAAGSFYFSHDERAFDVATLIDLDSATFVDEDGEPTDEEIDVTKFSFGLDKEEAIDGLTPEDVYNNRVTGAAYQFTPVYVYYEGELVKMKDENGKDAYPEVYIGVKGDANLDGEAKADDAAEVLRYAAELGAGNVPYLVSEDNELLERFAYFLADVDGESMDGGETDAAGNEGSQLDAADAAYILAYSAGQGAGGIDWIGDEDGVFTTAPYPVISKAIYDAKKAG